VPSVIAKKEKGPDQRPEPFILSSLRWYYPNQVQWVYSQVNWISHPWREKELH